MDKIKQTAMRSIGDRVIREEYPLQLKVLEESFVADEGENVSSMASYFEQFAKLLEQAGEAERKEFAKVLGYHSAFQLQNTLTNRLFDYICRCVGGEFLPALSSALITCDKEGHFTPFLEKLALVDNRIEVKEASPAEFEVVFDIPYVVGASMAQKLDVYSDLSCETDAVNPAILYFHGGAWAYGDRFRAIKRLRHVLGKGYKWKIG